MTGRRIEEPNCTLAEKHVIVGFLVLCCQYMMAWQHAALSRHQRPSQRKTSMENEFAEKTLLITGATSGIGKATALRFAQAGASIAAVGRNETALLELQKEFDAAAKQFLAIPADLSRQSDRDAVIPKAVDRFGGIDVLVNAAGHISNGTIESTSLPAWDEMLEINLRTPFVLMQQALPTIIKRRGNIINVSSVTGLRSFPGVLAYCVSKAGLDQLTRCAALELAGQGVRVNAVNPGVVVTEIHKRGGMTEEQYEAFLKHSKTTHPLGRVGQAREIAELIFFLASERASWITGATYSIDGGRSLTCAR
jgi:NAD(P)-dependent dehydrogenase (short-subunit alcohol dehydrogenase family)